MPNALFGLKRLGVTPKVLHLSTHGFYLSNPRQVERSLVLSGLALAGANQSLKEKVGLDGEDGICCRKLKAILPRH